MPRTSQGEQPSPRHEPKSTTTVHGASAQRNGSDQQGELTPSSRWAGLGCVGDGSLYSNFPGARQQPAREDWGFGGAEVAKRHAA